MAQALRELDPDGEIVVVGRRGGVAEPLVTAAGLKLETLDVSGVDLASPLSVASLSWRLPASTVGAGRILGRARAEVVVGTGGYVCVPVVAAAAVRRLPVVLLEQNAVPGRAIRLLARRARYVATSFQETARHLPGARTVLTGNPVRREVLSRVPAPVRESLRHLLVMGGSQGARTLNRAVLGSLRDMLEEHADLRITHQCGVLDAAEVSAAAAGLPSALAARYHAAPFFSDMADRIAASDLVLMRAGGSSLAECAAIGRPMLLVPYPHAGGHQEHNVASYVAAGAAVHIADSECRPERVRREVGALVRETERWRAMSAASAALGRPRAADDVVALIMAAVRPRHGRRAA